MVITADKLSIGQRVRVKIHTHAPCRLKACGCEYHPRGPGMMGRWAYYVHTRTGRVVGPSEDIPSWLCVRLTRPYPDDVQVGHDAEGWPIFETSRTYFHEVDLEPDELVEVL